MVTVFEYAIQSMAIASTKPVVSQYSSQRTSHHLDVLKLFELTSKLVYVEDIAQRNACQSAWNACNDACHPLINDPRSNATVSKVHTIQQAALAHSSSIIRSANPIISSLNRYIC